MVDDYLPVAGITEDNLRNEFQVRFDAPPDCVIRAPGRVNLIGEHTDYNDGLVLPMAIDRAVWIAARLRNDRIVRMVALDFGSAQSEFSLDAIQPDPKHSWADYPRGVVQLLGSNLVGADILIRGDVPIGSGLSSSAALQVCTAVAFKRLNHLEIENVDLARLCQRAENQFVGVQSGIMDQFVSLVARAGHALLIDCRNLSYHHVPLPRGAEIVVCDTKKRRGLVDSEYNSRRAECGEAARLLGVKSLRAAAMDDLKRIPEAFKRRARHVVSENDRVVRAVEACRRSDLAMLGRLMNESHASLRDDYEVSCLELDMMVNIAQKQKGCYGARLTGAGFGGCTVNLVAGHALPGFGQQVGSEYLARVGIAPEIFVCRASEGAG